MSWKWRLDRADGAAVSLDFDPPAFSAQGDAESWIGEVWRELADAGADQATLLEGDRVVYGPMSLQSD